MEKKNKKRKGFLFLLIGLAALILAAIIILVSYLYRSGILGNKRYGVLYQDDLITVHFDDVPQDTLYITQDRKAYKDGSMRLVVPRLDLDTKVGADTIPKALEEMPGLYEVSQMPSEGDVNVSIAGHRDIGHKEFYAQDTIVDGDYMYLVYEGNVFQYLFYESKIVEADDWSVILRQGFSALTLTTCDPIGTRLNRLITVGKLVNIYPETSDITYPSNINE